VQALTWRPTTAPVATRYDDIWFVTPEIGWAVNSNGQILKTTAGGASWEQQFKASSDEGENVWLRCVGFATESRGWVGTTSGVHRLYETRTWKVSGSPTRTMAGLAAGVRRTS
jgi:photosystem II stability/assembly factor-like uncharacterized protein